MSFFVRAASRFACWQATQNSAPHVLSSFELSSFVNYTQALVPARYDKLYHLSGGGQELRYGLGVVNKDRRREAEVLRQGVNDVKPDVDPRAVVQR